MNNNINSVLGLLVAIQERKDLLNVIQYLNGELSISLNSIAEFLGISSSALYLYCKGVKIPPKKEAFIWDSLSIKFLGATQGGII